MTGQEAPYRGRAKSPSVLRLPVILEWDRRYEPGGSSVAGVTSTQDHFNSMPMLALPGCHARVAPSDTNCNKCESRQTICVAKPRLRDFNALPTSAIPSARAPPPALRAVEGSTRRGCPARDSKKFACAAKNKGLGPSETLDAVIIVRLPVRTARAAIELVTGGFDGPAGKMRRCGAADAREGRVRGRFLRPCAGRDEKDKQGEGCQTHGPPGILRGNQQVGYRIELDGPSSRQTKSRPK
jgi:hypothetical protein